MWKCAHGARLSGRRSGGIQSCARSALERGARRAAHVCDHMDQPSHLASVAQRGRCAGARALARKKHANDEAALQPHATPSQTYENDEAEDNEFAKNISKKTNMNKVTKINKIIFVHNVNSYIS